MTRPEKLLALRAGIKWANENGLTRVHAAGGHYESGDFEDLDLYDEMRKRGDLSLRVQIAYFLDPPALRPQDLKAIENARTGTIQATGSMSVRAIMPAHRPTV